METIIVPGPVFLAHATVGDLLIGMFIIGIGINTLSPGYSEEV